MTATATINELLARPTLTVPELAAVLRVGKNQAYALVRERRIRSLRIGSRILIPTAAVGEFLDGP